MYLDCEYKDGKITYLGDRAENKGLAFSLNELLKVVLQKGYTYIARMDADDISKSNRFKLQSIYLDEHRDIDVVGGYIEEFSDEIDYDKIVRYPLNHAGMFDFFSKRVPLAHMTVMYRSTFFEKSGLYPTSSPTNEDTLMWMQGFKNGCKFANIPEILVEVRVNSSFFGRRGGVSKAWSDFRDRILVIRTLRYNILSYLYATAIFFINIAPEKIKKYAYRRFR